MWMFIFLAFAVGWLVWAWHMVLTSPEIRRRGLR